MVMMLSCIFGMPYSYRFESWMWYFVEQAMEEGDRIDWAGLISDNLNEQLMNLEHTRKFTCWQGGQIMMDYDAKGRLEVELNTSKFMNVIRSCICIQRMIT